MWWKWKLERDIVQKFDSKIFALKLKIRLIHSNDKISKKY